MTSLEQAILSALREHPHDDTLPQLLEKVGGDGDDVAQALESLRLEGLVITDGPHWQLSASGFRLQRHAA